MVDIFVPIRVSTAQIYAFILDCVASEEDFISSARFRETSDGLTERQNAVSRGGGSAVFPRLNSLALYEVADPLFFQFLRLYALPQFVRLASAVGRFVTDRHDVRVEQFAGQLVILSFQLLAES